LLLYTPGATAAPTLDDAASSALGGLRLPAGGRVGVYWETYGVRKAGEAIAVTLTVERTGTDWRTRAAERLHLARRVTPLQVRWQEAPAQHSGVAARAITVDLSPLPPARYRMQLTAAADDGSVATAERVLELVPR
jgi:hypothetical protein